MPAPHQVRLWQVHDGIDWSVCEDFVVVSVLPIPLLVALELAAPTPCCRLSSVGTVAAADNEASSSSSSSSSLSSSSPSSSLSSSSVSVFERVPASVLDLFVAPCLLDVDVARALCASRGTCSVLAGSMSSRAQWRVVAAVLEQDPKVSQAGSHAGTLFVCLSICLSVGHSMDSLGAMMLVVGITLLILSSLSLSLCGI